MPQVSSVHKKSNSVNMGQKPLKALQDPSDEGKLYPVCTGEFLADPSGFQEVQQEQKWQSI